MNVRTDDLQDVRFPAYQCMIAKDHRTRRDRWDLPRREPRPASSSGSNRRRRLSWLLLVCIVIGGYAGRRIWLTAVGSFLVSADSLQRAEIVVVLAGDGEGGRIMKAVELVREGYAPRILVDGPIVHYGVAESVLAMNFAVRHGAPKEILDPFPMDARSTLEEAKLVDAELRRREIRKALVVTSNFHTSRARSIFHKQGSGEVEYVFVAAAHPEFAPERWWRTREGKKIVVLEYLKTLYSLFE